MMRMESLICNFRGLVTYFLPVTCYTYERKIHFPMKYNETEVKRLWK